jgi:putative endonuclease
VWYLYIIRCFDNSLYTGITTDVPRRINEHNQKTASNYTRTRTPVKLVYQESHLTRSFALKREAQIKRWTRGKKLELIKGLK